MKRVARRDFLKTSSALAAASLLPGCAMEPAVPSRPIGRVIVIGGGFGGATAAKYLRMWSEGTIEVFLIERNPEFISCPTSNLVLGGTKTLAELTRSYAKLREYGVQILRDEATAIDVEKKRVSLKRIEDLPYDRLIVSPAVDFMHDAIEGYDAEAQKTVLHAWKAGPETVALRQQLEGMPDGGVCVIGVPRSPFRCPPGPYERACQIASYFKKAKPRSKVIVLDANEDIVSKPALFKAAWNDLYKGTIEYRGNNEIKAVDARAKTVKTDFDTIKGDVLNVLPPMRAGDIANNHGKLAAAAIIELMNGRAPNPQPVIANTCYSFVSDKEVIHVASVHRYDPAQKTLTVVPGASGVSTSRSELEGTYGWAWAQISGLTCSAEGEQSPKSASYSA